MAKITRSITQFKREEVLQLWQESKRATRCPYFVLLHAPKQSAQGRILLIIAKKIGAAPERNRLRRRVKVVFLEGKMYEQNFDWIFIACKGIHALGFQTLREKLIFAFAKALPGASLPSL